MSDERSEWTEMVPGVRRRIREDGEQLMLVEVHLDLDAVVPVHHHVHEQMTYVVSGKLAFEVDGKPLELAAGQSLKLPSNVPHGVRAMEATVVLDMFSPPREDFRK
jgi:quercetin dioxygenase-like cupin family protein